MTQENTVSVDIVSPATVNGTVTTLTFNLELSHSLLSLHRMVLISLSMLLVLLV